MMMALQILNILQNVIQKKCNWMKVIAIFGQRTEGLTPNKHSNKVQIVCMRQQKQI